jgi:hypothetical protein
MTPRRHRLDDRSADALLSGRAVADEPALTAFVAQVQSRAAEAPAPSAELAAMLEHGVPAEARVTVATPVVAPPARRAVSWTRYALVGTAALAGLLGAGAANALPAPAQRAVADVVEWVTPLHLPRPAADEPTPAVVPSSTPTPSQAATPAPAATRSPEPEQSGDDDATEGPDASEGPSADGSSTDGTHETAGPDGDATSSPEPSSPSDDNGSSDSSDGDHATPTPDPTRTAHDSAAAPEGTPES